MSQKNYSNTNYIIYFDENMQYTSANNSSIFNLYDNDTLYSMWVNIRTFDFPICNKGWTLKTENGIPVFTVDYKGKPVSVQATGAINDAEWHLLC